MGNGTIRIHPENSKVFQFRGRPIVLVCATEHYGSVMNRPFNFERYLADAKDKSQTLTRLFTLFRELQLPNNPYSPCKPESPDYISPFKRVGPANALDGEPKYDLSQWNPEFFERLHRFLSMASDYGIIVEITLFSDAYCEPVWKLNPLNSKNNVSDVETIRLQDYITERNPKMFAWQCSYVRKIAQEVDCYDNVFFEICNEPSGQEGVADPPSLEEVDAWQMAVAQVIRETESQLPNRHLIAGAQGFMNTAKIDEQYTDKSFQGLDFNIVNVHPSDNMIYGGETYHLGGFMCKQLKIRQMRNYCLATYYESKPLNMDEDNIASQYKDYEGWTIHRKRAWITLLSGGHYDFIDFSIINYCETGTPESQRCIRSWMKYLSEFIHSLDIVQAKPLTNFLKKQPKYTVEAILGVENKDYCIYLADERELDQVGAGEKIVGEIILNLPKGNYEMASFSPVTGLYSPWLTVFGGDSMHIAVPEFQHDIVLRLRHKL